MFFFWLSRWHSFYTSAHVLKRKKYVQRGDVSQSVFNTTGFINSYQLLLNVDPFTAKFTESPFYSTIGQGLYQTKVRKRRVIYNL